MIKSDKKGLWARLDDIYKWSVKSGVAVATSNSLKVQWDKVIEELNELLYHCYFHDVDKVIDDFGDIAISFINLLNIDPSKKKGVFAKNEKRMYTAAKLILENQKLSTLTLAQMRSDEMYVIDAIFSLLHYCYKCKSIKTENRDLFNFLVRLVYLHKIVTFKFGIRASLRNCIYTSYREIQGRRYEIRVR